ncbi:hypothetical protein F4820DRAFT_447533 [Hypoxylon rubiginosum]|uniref:Uncharacterized protein n=1 Tax=Hypoxylon rubiginosum TaxID=110542 RepID=A0ACB9Z2Z9_9PEZI|nr:hypothetical protein F4820DRAFT_447533 [Hypoxylon rubiginosum]
MALNLALDVAIVGLPMPWLWRLHMALGKKLVIMVMFSFGFATIAIMCLRIEQTVNGNVDRMEATANLGLLSAVELWLGIIVACMPTMAPFVRRYVQPGLSKLSQKLRGNSCQSTKQVNPRLQLRTFGGSGPPNSKKHNNYTELSDTSTFAAQSSDELRLVANDTHKLRTDCGFNQNL